MESIHANTPNLERLRLYKTELDIIPDKDAIVTRDCRRLIDNDALDIVTAPADKLVNLEFHFDGNWHDLDF